MNRRSPINSEPINEETEDPKEFLSAVSFVDQLSDLYDEEGFRELTPSLSEYLDSSIETPRKYKDYKPWVERTLENAENLRELMPDLEFI